MSACSACSPWRASRWTRGCKAKKERTVLSDSASATRHPALARAEHLVGFSIRRAGGRSGARPRSRTAAALSGSPRHGVSIAGRIPSSRRRTSSGSRSRAWRRMRAKCRASGPSGRGRPARRAAGRSPCPRLFRRRVAFGVGAEFTALAVHVDAPLGAFFPEPRGRNSCHGENPPEPC